MCSFDAEMFLHSLSQFKVLCVGKMNTALVQGVFGCEAPGRDPRRVERDLASFSVGVCSKNYCILYELQSPASDLKPTETKVK